MEKEAINFFETEDSLQTKKRHLRKEMLKLRNQMSQEEKRTYEDRLVSSFLLAPEVMDFEFWYLYISKGSEFSTDALLRFGLTHGRRVACPCVGKDRRSMDFFEITGKEDLKIGYRGILEPEPLSERLCCEPGLMLLPGLAYDRKGKRLGYGGGFYDRYLSRFESGHFYRTALAYPFQVCEDLPADDRDEGIHRLFV